MKRTLIVFIVCIVLMAFIVSCNKPNESSQNTTNVPQIELPTETTITTEQTVTETIETTTTDETIKIKPEEIKVVGAWDYPENNTITQEAKSVVTDYIMGIDGIGLRPIALVATRNVTDVTYQTLIEKNYIILCESKAVMPNAEGYFILAYFTRHFTSENDKPIDSKRSVTLDKRIWSGEKTLLENTPGSYYLPETPELTSELKNVFNEATENNYVAYTPIFLVECQVVEGMNYCYFCSNYPPVPELEPRYTLVYIYKSSTGEEAKVTSIVDFKN